MPNKLETKRNTAKLKSSPQKPGGIQKDEPKPTFGVKVKVGQSTEREKAIAQKAASEHTDKKKHKDQMGRKPCPNGMAWDDDLNKCV